MKDWCNTIFQLTFIPGHNSAAPDALLKFWRWWPTLDWDAKLAWYSPRATCWICFCSLEHGLGIHGFKPTGYPSDISRTILFLYCDYLLHNMAEFKLTKHKLPNLTTWHILTCAALKSHVVQSNAQHVSALSITILPTTVGTFHSLNCFGHGISTSQTNSYANIAKLLIYLCSLNFFKTSILFPTIKNSEIDIQLIKNYMIYEITVWILQEKNNCIDTSSNKL